MKKENLKKAQEMIGHIPVTVRTQIFSNVISTLEIKLNLTHDTWDQNIKYFVFITIYMFLNIYYFNKSSSTDPNCNF